MIFRQYITRNKNYFPYSLVDKVKYFAGKIFCSLTSFVGTEMTNEQINAIHSKSDLEMIKNRNSYQSFYHLKMFFINGLIAGKYSIDCSENMSKSLMLAFGSFAIGHIYSFIFYKSSQIKCDQRKCLVEHFEKIDQNIKFLKLELKILDEIKDLDYDREHMEFYFETKLSELKQTWIMFNHSNRSNLKYFIIFNKYYSNLYFIFESHNSASDFMLELKQLTDDQIDALNEDPTKIARIQNEFWRDRIYCSLIRGNLIEI